MKAYYLRYNMAAFILSILKKYTPEESMYYIYTGQELNKKLKYNEMDTVDMINLKESGVTLKEIGEIYGISFSAVSHRISRYKKSKGMI